MAEQLVKDQKRVVVFNMHGGLSQLESWDPKPGTNTGGPFRAIPTSVPGMHISELLPYTAKQMHHLALVRSINTKENDHGKGAYMMLTRPQANAGRRLSDDRRGDGQVPGVPVELAAGPHFDHARRRRRPRQRRGLSGPTYSSITLGNGNPPQNSARPGDISQTADDARQAFRRVANEQFLSRRRTALTDAYTAATNKPWS